MPEKTEAQKKAQRQYMEKFALIQIRMEQEKKTVLQSRAVACGQSVNAFINEAIDEKLEREDEGR